MSWCNNNLKNIKKKLNYRKKLIQNKLWKFKIMCNKCKNQRKIFQICKKNCKKLSKKKKNTNKQLKI